MNEKWLKVIEERDRATEEGGLAGYMTGEGLTLDTEHGGSATWELRRDHTGHTGCRVWYLICDQCGEDLTDNDEPYCDCAVEAERDADRRHRIYEERVAYEKSLPEYDWKHYPKEKP